MFPIKGQINDQNTRLVAKNTIGSMIVKIASIVIALLTTPAYIEYFNNNEILGAWFTILSVLAWILNCDMGIGNGLRNNLVYSIAKNDKKQIKTLISSSYLFLCSMAIAITCIAIFLGKFISWNEVFNLSDQILNEKIFNKAVTILIISIILQFVLRLITSILYALQKAFIPALLSLCTNMLMLFVVNVANVTQHNNNIVLLAFSYLIAVNCPLIVATIVIFHSQLKDSKPNVRDFEFKYALSVIKVGGVFLWLQFMSLILDNTNSYLITAFIGNSAVVEYQIYYKLFSLPGAMVVLISTSLWSVITKAKAEQNYTWIKRTYKLFMLFGGLVCLSELLIVVFLQPLFNLWLGQKTIPVNYTTAIIFAVSGSIMAIRTILCTFSNGMCELRTQGIFLTIGAVINIPLAFILAQQINNYIAIVIANIISMIPYCIAQPILFHRSFKKPVPQKTVQMDREGNSVSERWS